MAGNVERGSRDDYPDRVPHGSLPAIIGGLSADTIMSEHIDVAFPSGDGLYHLELSMGAGTLHVNPDAVGKIVQGTITYSVEELKPIVFVDGVQSGSSSSD